MPARILVIEDNATNLELMVYLLSAFGHVPLQAGSGEMGIAIARQGAVDLVLMDIQMPELDGHGTLRMFRNEPGLRKLRVVAVTALAMYGDREKILASGFDGYLAKPITPETFVQQVDSFLVPALRSLPLPDAPPLMESPPPLFMENHVRILVVDDTASNRQLYRSLLEAFGYDVVEACNVAEGLRAVRELKPNLILCDVHMPGGNGWELIRAVRLDVELRGVPFMFLSATLTAECDRQFGLSLGANRFLLRPVESSTLLEAVQSCLVEAERGGRAHGSGPDHR